MSTQTEKPKDNLLVKLVKKSVGLPTGDCCGVSVQENEAESCCSEQPSTATETSGCGCGKAEASGGNEQPSAATETSGCGCGSAQSSDSSEQNSQKGSKPN